MNTKISLNILNVEEFAELLGVKTNSVYKWHSQNALPEKIFRKIGSRLIFIADEVEKWILKDRCQLVRIEKKKEKKNDKF